MNGYRVEGSIAYKIADDATSIVAELKHDERGYFIVAGMHLIPVPSEALGLKALNDVYGSKIEPVIVTMLQVCDSELCKGLHQEGIVKNPTRLGFCSFCWGDMRPAEHKITFTESGAVKCETCDNRGRIGRVDGFYWQFVNGEEVVLCAECRLANNSRI
jgi:hypothetical protein